MVEGGKVVTAIVIGAISFAVLLMIILIPLSIENVEANEYAAVYNDLSNVIDDEILAEGRYVLDPASRLIIFPRTLETIDMTGSSLLRALTSDGLQMELDITVQFALIREHIPAVVREFGVYTELKAYITQITRANVKDVCSRYSAEDFFFKRAEIEQAMISRLTVAFMSAPAYATASLVQLRNVNHPDLFEQENQAKELVKQERAKALNERAQQETEETTKLSEAEADARITIIQADAQALSTIAKATEEANAITAVWAARATSFATIRTALNVTGDEFVDTYLRYTTLVQQPATAVITLQ